MNRPKHILHKRPQHIREYPVGPAFQAGYLPDKNAGWRTFRPVIDQEACVNCMMCYLVCPDGTIYKTEEGLKVDYDFCKGCGVCANQCHVNAIKMVKEEHDEQ
ncbi:MAG: 4Fe-4S binding protein [Bacteroidales bacterium]|jgi:pyruvate ferredoxin oxidoreductase delta subunit